MLALELVDILPELNGALPHLDEGRWWIAREGRFVEVGATLRVNEPVNERALDDLTTSVVRLQDGGTLAVEERDAGFAIVRSNGERFAVDAEDTEPVALAHPRGTGAVFEFPMGQDGTRVIAVDVLSGSMVCREMLPGDECTAYGSALTASASWSVRTRTIRPWSACSAGRTVGCCTNSTTSPWGPRRAST
jgi:hypothetical protein